MANDENLKNGVPYQFRAGEEQAKRSREAGKASGAARRKKRDMRQAAQFLLNLPAPKVQKNLQAAMDNMGIPEEERTNNMAVLVAMIIKAQKENVEAAKFIRDTAGYNPADQLLEKQFAYQKKRDKEKDNPPNQAVDDWVDIMLGPDDPNPDAPHPAEEADTEGAEGDGSEE